MPSVAPYPYYLYASDHGRIGVPELHRKCPAQYAGVGIRGFGLISLCLISTQAFAHVEQSAIPSAGWTFEPWVLACLALSIFLYVIGALRLVSRTQKTQVMVSQCIFFSLGWLSLFIALVTPLDALGNRLFSAHMVQHELLMIVAAPLLVMSRPFGVWVWALPPKWRHGIGMVTRHRLISLPWKFLSQPATGWSIHALALWLWHIPALFDAALVNNTIHTLQHTSFLVTALFFWWALLNARTSTATSGVAIIYLFTTMLHTGALGALLTFSMTPWYSAYHETSMVFGLSPIEDQQLGGLIMWIPGGFAYLIAGLVLGGRWLRPGNQANMPVSQL